MAAGPGLRHLRPMRAPYSYCQVCKKNTAHEYTSKIFGMNVNPKCLYCLLGGTNE